MNILIHTNISPFQNKQKFGGAETSLKLIAEKLTEKGHQVFFIAKTGDRPLTGIQHKKVGGINLFLFGKSFLPFGKTYKFKKFLQPLHYKFLKRILKKNKIDIVHTYYNPSICDFYLSCRDSIDFKLAVRIAGLKWYEDIKSNKIDIKVYKRIFENSDLLNFISQGLFDNFLQLNDDKNFGIRLPDYFIGDIGVDVNKMKSSFSVHQNDEFRLVMATRFSLYQKRQDILVKAIKELANKIPCKLYLIGEGPNRENIEKLIRENNLSNHIEIIPFMEQEKLFDFIKKCDVLCHCCEYEGLSKMIIETMYLGVPVLVSNVFPLNDYITDGVNGYIVDNTSMNWAEKIEQLYKFENSNFSKITKNAVNYIENNYNADKNIEIYQKEFKNLN
jgi:glycosyltransferase involved in cell wall biosynthesis